MSVSNQKINTNDISSNYTVSHAFQFENIAKESNILNKMSIYGVRVAIKDDLCDGCGICIAECDEKVLAISGLLNSQNKHPVVYLGEGCNGCGICTNVCHIDGAIRIYRRIKPN